MRPRFRAVVLAAAATLLIAAPGVASATPVEDGCPSSGALTSIADLLAEGPYGVPGAIDDPANGGNGDGVGSSRVDLQACKLEYSIVSPK